MAEFLLTSGIANSVHLHPKQMPWFVSDVTQTDLDWTLSQLSASKDSLIAQLGKTWTERIKNGSFVIYHHDFWTLPYDFPDMKSVAPDLYIELSKADLIFFKGDLNYRKLTKDRKWDPVTEFESALMGFHPSPLCALRTLKCDLAVGLKPGQAEEIQSKNKDWMITGEYGVIHFSDKKI